ncbi:hypothetical protein CPAV1605_1342 [seawater metagenome]|uniref:C-CAP/cofactor C-like domain-containing protein n=1 Tax=seawater metagenome TaxID=1561972 RepID=A0A5E8CMI9_9ZZZZ
MNPLPEFNENTITLSSLNNQDQDFQKLFNIKNSLTYLDCENMKINFDAGINKLVLKGSKNLEINIGKVISGIDIISCHDITIYTKINEPVYSFCIEKSSNIKIKVDKSLVKSTSLILDESIDIKFFDFQEKIISINKFNLL